MLKPAAQLGFTQKTSLRDLTDRCADYNDDLFEKSGETTSHLTDTEVHLEDLINYRRSLAGHGDWKLPSGKSAFYDVADLFEVLDFSPDGPSAWHRSKNAIAERVGLFAQTSHIGKSNLTSVASGTMTRLKFHRLVIVTQRT